MLEVSNFFHNIKTWQYNFEKDWNLSEVQIFECNMQPVITSFCGDIYLAISIIFIEFSFRRL
jgi:hypothetical protein